MQAGTSRRAAKRTAKTRTRKGTRDEEGKKDEEEFQVERFNVYGQATVITQWNGPFNSPYYGTNSFLSQHETATSETSTLFLGARFWQGCEVYFDPELAGGRG